MSKPLPEGWCAKKFKDVCGVANGQIDPTDEPYSNMKHIGPGNVEKFTGRLFDVQTASQDGQTSGKYLFNPTDVLYGKINPHFAKVAFPRYSGVCSADMYPVSCKRDLVPEYLYHHLLSDNFTNYAVSVSGRTGMPKINRDDLDLAAFNLPPINEQKKIASILTSVDEVIENTQKQIDKLQDLKKATMNELLTKGIGHTEFKDSELGRIPKSWEVKRMSEICSLHYGKSPKEIENNNGQYPIYGTGGIVGKSGAYLYSDESIVIGRKGSIDNISFVKSPFWAIDTTYYAEAKNVEMKWLFYRLQFEGLKKYNEASGVPSLNRETLYNIAIQSPPKSEQVQVCKILDAQEANISSLTYKYFQTQALKKSLMQDLLTGKVRVQVN